MNINETVSTASPLKSALLEGLDNVSQSTTVTFTKYKRVILPLDGFAYWVKASEIGPSALYNTAPYNAAQYNQTASLTTATAPNGAAPSTDSTDVVFQVKGSIHKAATQLQEQDQVTTHNYVIFQTAEHIQSFNQIDPNTIYLGVVDGVQFAFSKQANWYPQAGVYHYRGDALYSAMASQIIDDPRTFDTTNVVVSNSLPVWLSLNAIMPVYPSFLSQGNETPPYATIHIDPAETKALQAVPYLDGDSSHWQLAKDKVKITIYGLRNYNALDYQDYILNFMANGDIIGLMNDPIVRDEKRPQPELTVIAMKKTIEFEVSYYQTRMRQIAMEYIKSCVPNIILGV